MLKLVIKMQLTAIAVLLFVAAASAQGGEDGPPKGYHRHVGIPRAKRIKASEDRIAMDPTSRIYAGEYVEIEKFPFFAGLIIYIPKYKDPYSMCGAALLSDSRLVTAAHCNFDGELNAEWMRVVLGSSFLFRGGLRIVTHKIVSHPNYDYMIDANDIAMIYLPYKINFTSSIFPIALPNERDSTMSFENYYAYTIGFGLDERRIHYDIANSEDPDKLTPGLQKVVLKITTAGECRAGFPDAQSIPRPYQLCTSGEGGVGPCNGDSGGPLITYTNRKFMVGLTSFESADNDCGNGGPTVYTRVSHYMSFIREHAKLPKFTFKFIQPGNGTMKEIITVSLPFTGKNCPQVPSNDKHKIIFKC